MGVEVSEERKPHVAEAVQEEHPAHGSQLEAPAAPEARQGAIGELVASLRAGIGALEWRPVLLFGVGAGLLMPLSYLQVRLLAFVAGLVPVGTGLLLGRRVKGYYGLHGFMTGLIGALVALAVLGVMLLLTPFGQGVELGLGGADAAGISPVGVWLQLGGFTALSLITFCTFGASIAGRTEERNRQIRQEIEARGGRLQRPGTIRTPEDIRGLSLPQFGSYVSNLFKKHGFQFKDYRFIDKDKHLDIWMEYNNETWHLRLSVADKVTPGTVEGLLQDLKREGCRKGVVLTSTEFTPGAIKSAKGRPIVLIDGQTLYAIAEK